MFCSQFDTNLAPISWTTSSDILKQIQTIEFNNIKDSKP